MINRMNGVVAAFLAMGVFLPRIAAAQKTPRPRATVAPATTAPTAPPPATAAPPATVAPPVTAAPPAAPPATAPPATAPPGTMNVPPGIPGYRFESRTTERPNYTLITSGALMFGVTYLFSAGIAISGLSDDNEDLGVFLIPVVGPIVYAVGFDDDGGQERLSSSFTGALVAFMVIDSLVQATGVVLFSVGVAKPVTEDKGARIPEVRVGAGHATATWRF